MHGIPLKKEKKNHKNTNFFLFKNNFMDKKKNGLHKFFLKSLFPEGQDILNLFVIIYKLIQSTD